MLILCCIPSMENSSLDDVLRMDPSVRLLEAIVVGLSWLSPSPSLFSSKNLHRVLGIDVACAAPNCGRSYNIPVSTCKVSIPR